MEPNACSGEQKPLKQYMHARSNAALQSCSLKKKRARCADHLAGQKWWQEIVDCKWWGGWASANDIEMPECSPNSADMWCISKLAVFSSKLFDSLSTSAGSQHYILHVKIHWRHRIQTYIFFGGESMIFSDLLRWSVISHRFDQLFALVLRVSMLFPKFIKSYSVSSVRCCSLAMLSRRYLFVSRGAGQSLPPLFSQDW